MADMYGEELASRVSALLDDLYEKNEHAPFPLDQLAEVACILSRRIMERWNKLNGIIERHEAVIRRRWAKKSPRKRRELLLRVWPNIPLEHRSEYTHYWKALSRKENARNLFKKTPPDSCMWPYINLEDLAQQSSPLLIFLNARGRHLPSTFAISELQFAPFAKIDVEQLYQRFDQASMKFLTADSDPYGYLISCNLEGLARACEGFGIALHPGEGLQVLHIQHRIWDFLVRCCEEILHDIPTNALLSNLYPTQLEPPQLFDIDDNRICFSDSALRAPFVPRNQFLVHRLRQLAGSMYNNAKDHVWALREDPSYFEEVILSYWDHRSELVLDIDGKEHYTAHSGELMEQVLTEMILESHFELVFWDLLYDRIVKVENLSRKYPQGIDSLKDEPKEYFEAIRVLHYLLQARWSSLVACAKVNTTSCSPIFRSHLLRVDTGTGSADELTVRLKASLQHDQETWHVFNILRKIGDIEMRNNGTYFYLDTLETILRRDPSCRRLMTPRGESIITELSVVVECTQHVWIHPWSKRLQGLHSGPTQELIDDALIPLTHVLAKAKASFTNLRPPPDLGDPRGGRFYYPCQKSHNKTNVEMMRKAERNLDIFWQHIDLFCKKKTKDDVVYRKVLQRLFDDNGSLRRTAAWVDRPNHDQSNTSLKIEHEYFPISKIFHDSSKEVTGSFDKLSIASKSKTKTKTRGAALEIEQAPKDLTDPTGADVRAPKLLYHVSKNAYRVFNTLFHSSSDLERPGKLKWTAFISALVELGFSADKLHGSAWAITPRSIKVTRGIQFHEPHPSGEIDYLLARRFGRRLNRAYGWDSTTFKQK